MVDTPEADRLPPLKVLDLRVELEQITTYFENHLFPRVSRYRDLDLIEKGELGTL